MAFLELIPEAIEEVVGGAAKLGEEAVGGVGKAGEGLIKDLSDSFGSSSPEKKKKPNNSTWTKDDIDYSNASPDVKARINGSTKNTSGWSDRMINHINEQKAKKQAQYDRKSYKPNFTMPDEDNSFDTDEVKEALKNFSDKISFMDNKLNASSGDKSNKSEEILEAINSTKAAMTSGFFLVNDTLKNIETILEDFVNEQKSEAGDAEKVEVENTLNNQGDVERSGDEDTLKNQNRDTPFNPAEHNGSHRSENKTGGNWNLGSLINGLLGPIGTFLKDAGMIITATFMADIVRKAFPETIKYVEDLPMHMFDAFKEKIEEVLHDKGATKSQRDQTSEDYLNSFLEKLGNRGVDSKDEYGYSRSTDISAKDLADLEASHRDKYNADQLKRFPDKPNGLLTDAQKKFGADHPDSDADMVKNHGQSNIINNNGTETHKSSDPRGIRNNNPGNLNFAHQKGATLESGPNGRFAVFKNMEDGIAADAHQISLYSSRGINTIRGIIGKWAPPTDNNNTDQYIANVAKRLGVSPDAEIDVHDKNVMFELLDAINKVEVGKGWVSDEQLKRGISQAFQSSPEKNQSDATPITGKATPRGPDLFNEKLNRKNIQSAPETGANLLNDSSKQSNQAPIIIAPSTTNNTRVSGGSSGGGSGSGMSASLASSGMPYSAIRDLA